MFGDFLDDLATFLLTFAAKYLFKKIRVSRLIFKNLKIYGKFLENL